MSEPQIFTATSAISYGWEGTKRHFVSLFLALGILTLLLEVLGGGAQRGGQGLFHLVIQIASMLVTMGWWRIALRVHDGAPASLSALTELEPTRVLYYFVTILLFWIVVSLGLVLLILPGIVVASRLFLAPAIVIDDNVDPIVALRRSYELTEGHTVPLIVLGLFLAGINFVGMLLLGLGLLATMPTSFLAVVYVYRRLRAHHEAAGSYRTSAA
jgi:uncharacterized membrane protein